MIQTLALSTADRVLVLLPHPDDESVAVGGLLQHALETGCEVMVVFFTDGDNNPWAQRASELRWRIGAADRTRFAATRRLEVRAALDELRLPIAAARFLGFPDQGTTDLLLHGNELAYRAVRDAIAGWRPTVVGGPSLLDLHPDHSALAVLAELALTELGTAVPLRRRFRFLVHNPRLRRRAHDGELVLPLTEAQRGRKRAAIACHRTQLVLRGNWLLSFAAGDERYYVDEPGDEAARHPVPACELRGGAAAITVHSGSRARAFGRRTLCIVGRGPGGGRALPLPRRSGPVQVCDPRDGTLLGTAEFRGARGRGVVLVPAELLPRGAAVFAKVEHAHGFFDEAGWRPLAVGTGATTPPKAQRGTSTR